MSLFSTRNLRHLVLGLWGAIFFVFTFSLVRMWMLEPRSEHVSFVFTDILPYAVLTSAALGFLTVVFATFWGVVFAWMHTSVDFWGKASLQKLFFVPIVIPVYIVAFVYGAALDYSGFLSTFLRVNLGLDFHLFYYRYRIFFAALILSFNFYPYVYLLVRKALESASCNLDEAASLMGASRVDILSKITWPRIRPWVIAGALLVSMETLADFGAVSVFSLNTLSRAIFEAWYSFDSFVSAVALAFSLVLLSSILVFVESLNNREKKFYQQVRSLHRPCSKKNTKFSLQCFVLLSSLGFLFLVLFFPVIQLLIWSAQAWHGFDGSALMRYSLHGLQVGVITSSWAVIFSLLAVLLYRKYPVDRWLQGMNSTLVMGYALPGSVLALLVFLPIVRLLSEIDFLDTFFSYGWSHLVLLAFGLGIRFMALSYLTLKTACDGMSLSMDLAARLLQPSPWKRLLKIKIPLLFPGILGAFLLVISESMKEIPLTMFARPFGWDTLATKVYSLTSEGEWQRAAVPSLCLIIVSTITVWIFHSIFDRRKV